MHCRDCGAELVSSNAAVCINCGASLAPVLAAQPDDYGPGASDGVLLRSLLLVSGLAAALALATALAG